MESGSQSTIAFTNTTARAPAWDTFVSATPECKNAKPGKTFSCLREANLTTLLNSWETVVASHPLAFAPAVDGPDGLIPDLPSKLLAMGHFARVPFIAGTNLDEGV